ncbi:hypothetical protein CDL15_Pgr000148 [Punica granatum]|uniref:Uncharacterized protein n=1 Tax=Punica granatum TaxID=22663 RepID=A0A218Y1W6_PUNGR|nr:hypothetical protein CDL15_Pgr000148 [Punica granatum]
MVKGGVRKMIGRVGGVWGIQRIRGWRCDGDAEDRGRMMEGQPEVLVGARDDRFRVPCFFHDTRTLPYKGPVPRFWNHTLPC